MNICTFLPTATFSTELSRPKNIFISFSPFPAPGTAFIHIINAAFEL